MYTCLSDKATAIPADNILHKNEIIGGINMGWGTFILGLSLLPPKILRLLEFVGLQGDKMLGHNLVVEAEKMDVLRSFVAAAGLLVSVLL